MRLDTNNHSVFKMHYHLILVVKYRRNVIDDPLSDRLSEIFENIGSNYHVTIKEWNHDMDHIHVLLTTKSNTNLSKFINAYKSASSRRTNIRIKT
ncbi:IS200/IS605 family transposase [Bacillus sp. V3B]|uniref:IS200/IS605 family transposase n=1 Tax=Bacillus sp. V3B TaxID=2804915 RepID=UPI0035C72C02|nr:IS200/IS605 family transposase [Bacillus sp. V3B]